MLKPLVSILAIGLVLGAGALAAKFMVDTKPKPAEKAAALPPPLVRTVLVQAETLTETIVGYGTARPYRSALLTAEVGGEIVELAERLRDGSPVHKGQLLARIDDRRYAQALEQKIARAQAEEAQLRQLDVREANLRRLLGICEGEVNVTHDEERRLAALFEGEAASKKEFDFARLAYNRSLRESTGFQNQLDLIEPQRRQRRASHQGMLAEVEIARLDVEHCRIVAPFAGTIDELQVEVGERLQRGSAIAGLIDPQSLEVPIELPVSAYARVVPGAGVELWLDSMPNLRWLGRVERKSPDADEESRTFRAYVEVDNREQTTLLVPGYFLAASVTGPVLTDALLVPRGALVGDHVFVANDHRVRRRAVHVERYFGERAVVSGELQPGDALIVTNLDKLRDDMAVRVREPAGQQGS